MIRTHRPRGYQWTAASEFQQTPLFRDISYEDAEIGDGDLLLADSDDEFPLSKRILKRRRVETLADHFLNGQPLDILSVRPAPEALFRGLPHSCDKPESLLQAAADFDRDEAELGFWSDVEDDWEFLKQHCTQTESTAQLVKIKAYDESAVQDEIEIEVQQASCQRRRSRRLARITLGPSDDALCKAAALRSRSRRVAQPDMTAESLPQTCPKKVIGDSQANFASTRSIEQDGLSDCGPSPTPAWTSAMWRKKGAFKPPRKPRAPLKRVDQDCSRDELGFSSFSVPSQANCDQAGARIVPGSSPVSGSQSAAVAALISSADVVSPAATNNLGVVHDQVNAFSTIGEGSAESSTFHDERSETPVSTRLLQRELRSSCMPHTSRSAGGTPMVSSVQECCEVARRRSAPTESQQTGTYQRRERAGPNNARNIVQNQYNKFIRGKNSSPFLFRKRSLRRKSARKAEATSGLQTPQCKSDAVIAQTLCKNPAAECSDGLESGRGVETPLLDAYGNKKLPAKSASASQSTSLRSSLRQELIASGAERSLLKDIQSIAPNTTSCDIGEDQGRNAESTFVEDSFANYQDTAENEAADAGQVSGRSREVPALWQCTQAMLAQAQHELFTSPDNSSSALYLGDVGTPQVQPLSEGRRRRPLGALSQEPIPSTQALLQDWGGWSTIKKPRQPEAKADFAHSPIPDKNIPIAKRSGTLRPCENRARCRSSLRFSLSFSQESAQDDATAAKPSSLPPPARSTDLVPATMEKFANAKWPKPSGKIVSTASFILDMSSLRVVGTGDWRSAAAAASNIKASSQQAITNADATTVSLRSGPSPSAPARFTPESNGQPVQTSQVSREEISVWHSPTIIKPAASLDLREREGKSYISELSFGAPDIQPASLGEPTRNYLTAQNAQSMSQYNPAETRSMVSELAEHVLGSATNLSF